MKISRELNLKLTQKFSLSQDLLLSLKMIQLPLLELRERIDTELLENPALEMKENKVDDEQDIETIENSFAEKEDYFIDSSSADINVGLSPDSSKMDQNRQFLEGAIAKESTLFDHLLFQLECQNLTEKQKEIGRMIISLIDPDGFFTANIDEVFKDEDKEIAHEVLEIIQILDPPGIASKNIQEALLYQIESKKTDEINQTAYKIIKDHFDLMIARKDNELIKKLKITREVLKDAYIFLSFFNPYPGREFSPKDVKYIMPDAYVYKKDNTLYVEMNDDILPSLTINKYLQKIALNVKRKRKITEDQKYIVNKVQNAHQFIKLVNYRNKSLFKLVLSIANAQEDFFYKGPKFLKPLTMKEIADQLGLSESTISRLASSKYIQTEWGIHEIKYFFSNAINKNLNDTVKSSESVRELIKEILENKKDEKISDQKIMEILQNKGIKIARRTVAKYRNMLNILSSHKRNL
ncbi:MAG: RNA polymerase factor sigma-54 [Spirochaetes bacterium]|nr:RNA polymerase factor sigma-54 [Spirochaetota bacterium]